MKKKCTNIVLRSSHACLHTRFPTCVFGDLFTNLFMSSWLNRESRTIGNGGRIFKKGMCRNCNVNSIMVQGSRADWWYCQRPLFLRGRHDMTPSNCSVLLGPNGFGSARVVTWQPVPSYLHET